MTRFGVLLLWLLLLGGCVAPPTAVPSAETGNTAVLPPATAVPLPTLYPTNTPADSLPNQAQPTQPPPTAVASPTPFDFSQPVIKLQYSIPALQLDRRLEGTAASTIRLFDITSDQQVDLRDQSRVLLQLQNALLELELADLPDDCDRCVQVIYDLPLSEQSGSGWLQDDILLASIENYFTVWLGPHFPPDTQIGLHRTASAYNVAHTVALTAVGEIWRWQATDPEVTPPAEADNDTLLALVAQVEDVPFNRLEREYRADCESFPRETLYLGGEVPWQAIIECPNYSLPTPLVPLYQIMDALAQPALDPERNRPLPDQLLSLDTLVYFQRPDGATLTLLTNGDLIATDAEGITSTNQLAPSEITPLITELTTSGVLPRGVQNVIDRELELTADTLLLVRGELGVYEFAWSDNVGQALLPAIVRLDELLVAQVGFIQPTPEATATESVTATGTITSTEIITP